jgi:hypothetical protein
MWSGGIQGSGNRPIANNSDMPSIRTIALRALLVPPPSGRLCRLGQVHHSTNTTQLVGDEPPTSRRLQPNLELLAAEPLAEPSDPSSVRRRDPRACQLTDLGVDPLSGDLRPVLVKPHHDRHLRRLLVAPRTARPRPRTDQRRPIAGPGRPSTCHLSSHAGDPRRRRATRQKPVRPKSRQAKSESARRQPDNQPDEPDNTAQTHKTMTVTALWDLGLPAASPG